MIRNHNILDTQGKPCVAAYHHHQVSIIRKRVLFKTSKIVSALCDNVIYGLNKETILLGHGSRGHS